MRERDLNYQHLRYFEAVARLGSVQRAARELHLSPSTVSAQIKTLEERLGQPLFDRVGRGLGLTGFGRQVLVHAAEVFARGEEIAALAGGSRRRELRLGVSSVLPKLLVREMLLPAMGPGQVLVVEHGPAEELFGGLVARRFDAVFTDAPTPGWVAAETFDHLVVRSPMAVFGAPALRDAVGQDLPGGLVRVPWIVPPRGTMLRAALERWWHEHDLDPEIAAVVDDSAVIKALGDAGVGVFAAPAHMEAAILHGYAVETIGIARDVEELAYVVTREAEPADPGLAALCRPLARTNPSE